MYKKSTQKISFMKNFYLNIIELILLYNIAFPFSAFTQKATPINAPVTIIGFYNFENFYDTTDQLNVSDEEFLPNSTKGYNSLMYKNKSEHLASVIYSMGNLEKTNGISLLGIAEIENKNVLKKLANETFIKKYNYQFIHFDSKDIRGIDVALMYHPQHFKPYQYRSYSLSDANHFTDYATRDILYVQGQLNNTWVHILVNHWPSRRGGEKKSMDKRIWAAKVCKRIIDSITYRDSNAKFIVMGDFNDNPNNKSIKHLNMYNPFLTLFNKGIGSMAFRDSWSLFDQILLSKNWPKEDGTLVGIEKRYGNMNLKKNVKRLEMVIRQEHTVEKIDSPTFSGNANANFGLKYCKSIIYRSSAMTEQEGRYQGYPKRTWNGDEFRGGYSDHYPAVIIFKSKNDEKPLK